MKKPRRLIQRGHMDCLLPVKNVVRVIVVHRAAGGRLRPQVNQCDDSAPVIIVAVVGLPRDGNGVQICNYVGIQGIRGKPMVRGHSRDIRSVAAIALGCIACVGGDNVRSSSSAALSLNQASVLL